MIICFFFKLESCYDLWTGIKPKPNAILSNVSRRDSCPNVTWGSQSVCATERTAASCPRRGSIKTKRVLLMRSFTSSAPLADQQSVLPSIRDRGWSKWRKTRTCLSRCHKTGGVSVNPSTPRNSVVKLLILHCSGHQPPSPDPTAPGCQHTPRHKELPMRTPPAATPTPQPQTPLCLCLPFSTSLTV